MKWNSTKTPEELEETPTPPVLPKFLSMPLTNLRNQSYSRSWLSLTITILQVSYIYLFHGRVRIWLLVDECLPEWSRLTHGGSSLFTGTTVCNHDMCLGLDRCYGSERLTWWVGWGRIQWSGLSPVTDVSYGSFHLWEVTPRTGFNS